MNIITIPNSKENCELLNEIKTNKRQLTLSEKIIRDFFLKRRKIAKEKLKIKKINIKRIKFAEKKGYVNDYLIFLKKKFNMKNYNKILKEDNLSIFDDYTKKIENEEPHREFCSSFEAYLTGLSKRK